MVINFVLSVIDNSPFQHRRRLLRKCYKTDLCNETKVRQRDAHKRADEKLTQGKPKRAKLNGTPPTFGLPLTMGQEVDTQEKNMTRQYKIGRAHV